MSNALHPRTRPGSLQTVACLLLLGLAVLAVFGPSLRYGFLAWDDDVHITQNPYVQRGNAFPVRTLWLRPYRYLYTPLSYTVFALESAAAAPATASGELNPLPFRLVNICLHMLCAALVWTILFRISGARWPSFAGALLFAIHPLQVESVCWISEQRGLLAGALAMAALAGLMLMPGRMPATGVPSVAAARPSRSLFLIYALSTALFVLALFAKPTVVIIPLVGGLLLTMHGHLRLKTAAVLVAPWLVVAGIFAFFTSVLQPGAQVDAPGLLGRVLVAGDAWAFYFLKLLVPLGQAVDYGRTPTRVLGNGWLIASAWLVPVLTAVVAVRSPGRVAAIAWALFTLALLPVLGLVPFFFQGISTVADRYTYLAMFAPAYLLCMALPSRPPRLLTPAVCFVLAAYATGAAVRVPAWRDTFTLFERSLAVNPESDIAYNSIGNVYARSDQVEKAIVQFRKALDVNPDYVAARINLAGMLAETGRLEEAEALLTDTLRIDAGSALAHYNLGTIALQRSDWEEAGLHLTAAVKLNPLYANAYMNLGRVELERGNYDEAIKSFERALTIRPGQADVLNNIGNAHFLANDFSTALSFYEEALRIDPSSSTILNNLGSTAYRQGDTAGAIGYYRQALNVNPDDRRAAENLRKVRGESASTNRTESL